MSLRSNGSYVGPRPAGPSATVASGIWDLRTAGLQKRASAWPSPIEPDPNFSSVSLLLHADGSGGTFTDSSSTARTVTAYGSATQSSTQSKFGGKSAYFSNSTSDKLSISSNAAFEFGTGDFTVEAWIYQLGRNTYSSLFEIGNHLSSTGIVFLTGTDGFRVYSNGFFGSGGTATLNAWQHLAFSRSGSTLRVFIDGAESSNATFSNNLTDSSSVTVGYAPGGAGGSSSFCFNGYIDDLRVTKGVARYTANFTPPTVAFPDA